MHYKDEDVVPGDLLRCTAFFYAKSKLTRKGRKFNVPTAEQYYFVRDVYFELKTQVTYVRLEEIVNTKTADEPYEIGFPLWAFEIVDRAKNKINI